MTFIFGLWIGTALGAAACLLALGLGRVAAESDETMAAAYAERPRAARR
jgi:hypothetical protein